MLGCPPTSIISIPCRSTISTTWPLPGCTTSLETMPQHKWWAPSAWVQSYHVHLHELPDFLLWPRRLILTLGCLCAFSLHFRCRADASFFNLSPSRLSTRSETTHTPSCTCWLCRVLTLPATRLLFEKATRSVLLLLSPQHTHQFGLVGIIVLCDLLLFLAFYDRFNHFLSVCPDHPRTKNNCYKIITLRAS